MWSKGKREATLAVSSPLSLDGELYHSRGYRRYRGFFEVL